MCFVLVSVSFPRQRFAGVHSKRSVVCFPPCTLGGQDPQSDPPGPEDVPLLCHHDQEGEIFLNSCLPLCKSWWVRNCSSNSEKWLQITLEHTRVGYYPRFSFFRCKSFSGQLWRILWSALFPPNTKRWRNCNSITFSFPLSSRWSVDFDHSCLSLCFSPKHPKICQHLFS